MGCYLNHPDMPVTQKGFWLISQKQAELVPEPGDWRLPAGKVLICVIENVTFDAAFVILTPYDFRQARYDHTARNRMWLHVDVETARTMTPASYHHEPALLP